jgi:hypothetical protein
MPPTIALPEDPSSYYPSIFAWVFQVVLSLRFPHHHVYTSPLPHICYMPHSQKEPRPVCTEKVTNTIPDDPNNFTPLPHSLFPSTLANCQMVKKKEQEHQDDISLSIVFEILVFTLLPQPKTQNHECSNINSKLSMDFLMFRLLEVS